MNDQANATEVAKKRGGRAQYYPRVLAFRVPEGLGEAFDREARNAGCSPPEFGRRLLIAGLASQGVPWPPNPKVAA